MLRSGGLCSHKQHGSPVLGVTLQLCQCSGVGRMFGAHAKVHWSRPQDREVFVIEILYPTYTLNTMSYGIRRVWCWTYTQHTSFYLTSFVTDMNYIIHRHFFAYHYHPIHWYLTRILTFLSEQRAPFSTIFASRTFHNVKWSQHSNVQVSIFVTCLNFAGTGSWLWQLYVACLCLLVCCCL